MPTLTSVNRHTARLRTADHALAERIAGVERPTVDAVMRRASRLADHGALWWIVALLLAATGGRARRGAVRGLLSLVFASGLTNAVLKPLLPRRRPPARQWSNVRRGVRTPRSSAFPSGHSASAFAFATGVALESPLAGAAVTPLAAAVTYSRVHNGVHWPSDVVAGAAIGTAVAAGTRRWWAVRSDEPADVGRDRPAPALDRGSGVVVFTNRESGTDGADIVAAVTEALPDARIVEFDPDRDFAAQIDEDVRRHTPAALGVAGGDGTVVVVAAAAERHRLPLAVFPGGTFNHFARDVGAAEVSDTASAIESGSTVAVDRAEVVTDDGTAHPFLNTASLGGYPDAVRLRERWQPRLGKWVAAAAAMIRVLAAAEPLSVAIDGRPLQVWMLFIGNGRYSPGDQVPMSRPAITGGQLDIRCLRADRRWSRLRLLFAAATGTLGESRVYSRQLAETVTVRITGRHVALATDGEVVDDARHFVFRACPEALTVYRRPTPG
ncbi:undecaprenyl-diphosphatase [Rhodococcus triatomae]|uniref:Undecaprenyl-diphosphatase n=1 Tax=Rhodococcus triatomae TaxID=300028 RepID=A0A1G8P4L1_9NOCA|nr:undecaprenyl-diphosphatase [Rhodococcus triatomae]